VITGNWGSDLALLIKAGKDAGLPVNFYTYYAATTGVPTAMGASGAEHVKYVGYYNPTIPPSRVATSSKASRRSTTTTST
jgi:branched-chain amino acid transport system substrate-binding protein